MRRTPHADSGSRAERVRMIVSDQLGPIRRLLWRKTSTVRFLMLTENDTTQPIRSFLRQIPGAQEISTSEGARQRREGFRAMYIEFMGALNRRHQTLLWNAMPFTNKNPLSTRLCQDVYDFLVVGEALRGTTGILVVVTNSTSLGRFVRAWGRGAGADVFTAVRGARPLHGFVTRWTPAAILFAGTRSLVLWLLTWGVRARVSRTAAPDANGHPRGVDVVTTAFPPSSVSAQGIREAYFGPLTHYLERTGRRPILFGVFFERPLEIWRAIQRLRGPTQLLPVEACLSLGDLMRCVTQALVRWVVPPRVRGAAHINGVDVTRLVHSAIEDSCRSTSLFVHLAIYRAARRLGQTLPIQRWFYPYENRAWEKMIVAGVRQGSPTTRCIGYQHATITPSHFNLYLGLGEAGVTPLPDVIVTVGEVVHERLSELGNYPKGLLRLGCALRQHRTSVPQGPRRATPRPRRISRLLVALASSTQEYRHTYAFLKEAFTATTDYEVRIRPHPEFTLEEVMGRGTTSADRFYTLSSGPLDQELEWAHAVLYVSSTVSVEALSMGLPVVRLDLKEILSTDPLFEREGGLKWSAADPPELLEILRRIPAVSDGEFAQWQRDAQVYATRYLRPVTEERLKELAEA